MLRIAGKGKESPGRSPGLVDGLFQTTGEQRV